FAELMREIGSTYELGGLASKMRNRKNVNWNALLKGEEAPQAQVYSTTVPVLLGTYSDTFAEYSSSQIYNQLFGNNPDGTMTDYFEEVSYGQFKLFGDIYGWYRTPQTSSYYVGLNSGLGSSGKEFVTDLVKEADIFVDFSQYDNDGPDGIPNSGDDDGYVDAVIVVHTGGSASSGADNIWSHRSRISDYSTNDQSVNGDYIKVSDYAIQPEMRGSSNTGGSIITIGVFCHEFGHLLGLPDLYDRTDSSEGPDYESSAGIGRWGLMASGSYGGDGKHSFSPTHMSAWSKIQLGWIIPEIIEENRTNIIIPQVETNPSAFILWEDPYKHSRYFLLENRQQTGFDTYLKTSGLAIWHIDENVATQNDNEHRKLVDLESADGLNNLDNKDNYSDAGDLFPGSSLNREFNNYTNPNSMDYDNNYTGVSVSNISDAGEFMTCDVAVRPITGYVLKSGNWQWGMRGISGWGSSTARDRYGAVKFTLTEPGYLAGVIVTSRYSSKDVEVSVYENIDGHYLNNLLTSTQDHFTERGHKEVYFENPLFYNEGDEFVAVVKYIYANYSAPFDRVDPILEKSFYTSSSGGYDAKFSIWSDKNLKMRALIRTDIVSPSITLIDTLKYDSNTQDIILNYPYSEISNFRKVDFTADESVKIDKLLFYFAKLRGTPSTTIAVFSGDGGHPGELLFTKIVDHSDINTQEDGTGWTVVDISEEEFYVPAGQKFRVGYYFETSSPQDSLHILADDGKNPTGSSWEKNSDSWNTMADSHTKDFNLRIRAVTSRIVTDIVSETQNINLNPSDFNLIRNYPNPFNNRTKIEFNLDLTNKVSLSIYNILGEKVFDTQEKIYTPGTYSLSWDGRNNSGEPVSSGVYLVVLKKGRNVITHKIMLLK
ncbi:M6 family metalloprotease domain-containing protein, partial [candidate division KSB1 bacterium]